MAVPEKGEIERLGIELLTACHNDILVSDTIIELPEQTKDFIIVWLMGLCLSLTEVYAEKIGGGRTVDDVLQFLGLEVAMGNYYGRE